MKSAKNILVFISILLQSGFLFSQAVGDYRSLLTGTWGTRTNWERFDGVSWVVPTMAQGAPTSTAGVVTVLSPHVMTISAAVSIDQVTINSGATVQTSGAIILTIANGAGDDLIVNGTFLEGATSPITWSAGTTWQMGASGTYIKTTATAVGGWQTNYAGGISTIPSTANWIIRKIGGTNPVLNTIGAYYPNLTFEYTVAGTWTTATTSTFQGAGGFPTIKGNFDIGGSGIGTVNFLNQHTNATATLVQGNTIIRTGNTLSNYGTGIEVQGDITVDGTLQYDAADARRLVFSGGNAQSFSGAGTVNIFAMTMSKSANSLTLNRAITVDNVLTMTSGIINSTAANLLTVNTSGTVTGANNSSFVNGPVRYIGTAAFTFPVGKGSDYQPLGYGASAGGGVFWTETFDGVNGAWVSTNTGGNGASANFWYSDCGEDGQPAGSCGTGCTIFDNSMYLTYSAGAGAIYQEGSAAYQTNKRIESPTINCSGRTGITLAFNYIEFGEGTGDDATLWYYDGVSWGTALSNPAKTCCCACAACDGQTQGEWTAYSIALPASANNNPNVKIGFNWTQDGDASGTDPSFAVDDITLSAPATVDFTCEYFYADPTSTFNNVMGAGLAQIENCEYWILTRNAGTASKNVILNWDANSCMQAPATITDYRVARWDGAVWQNEGSTATTGAVPPAAGSITSGSVSNFSPFTIGSIVSWPLPIELLSFDAKPRSEVVDLSWITATEKNNDFFNVERSIDGKIFSSIGKVKGAGNSSTTLKYKLTDTKPVNSINYYRLKQTDFDGTYSYSKIVAVNMKNASPLEIVSIVNGSDGNHNAWIQSDDNKSVKLDIIDDAGKLIRSFHFQSEGGVTQIPLNTHSIPNGIYFLRASYENYVRIKKFSR